VGRLWRGVASRLGRLAGRGATKVPRARQLEGGREVPAAAATAREHSPAGAAGRRHLVYAPQLDGQADPCEIVWTWVAYEEEPDHGKDRPVLVVGRENNLLLGLMLSSQSAHDGQRNWFALGPGTWDPEDRPSWVRLDRVLNVAEDRIRREGAVLDRARFEAVARALRSGYGWR
jgi:hypothetical protein